MIERKGVAINQEMDYYGRAFKRALEFEQNIKRDMREGKKETYIVIEHAKGTLSTSLKMGDDLLEIAQGAAFGAYRVLAYDRIYIKETKEEIRVINPVGKKIADGIIRQYANPSIPQGVTEP